MNLFICVWSNVLCGGHADVEDVMASEPTSDNISLHIVIIPFLGTKRLSASPICRHVFYTIATPSKMYNTDVQSTLNLIL